MKIFQIVKNIYTNPWQAFDQATLDDSLPEAIVYFLTLEMLIWFSTYRKIPHGHLSIKIWAGILISTLIFAAIGWVLVFLLIRRGVRKNGSNLMFRSLVSGHLWIAVAMLPFNAVYFLLLVRYPQFHIFRSIFMIILTGAAVYLGICCVHGLSGLRGITCLKIIILAYLPFLALAAIPIILVVVLSLYLKARYPVAFQSRTPAQRQTHPYPTPAVTHCSDYITSPMVQASFGGTLIEREWYAKPDEVACIYTTHADSSDISVYVHPIYNPGEGERRFYNGRRQYCPQSKNQNLGSDSYECTQVNQTGTITWIGFLDPSRHYEVELISGLWVKPQQLEAFAKEIIHAVETRYPPYPEVDYRGRR